MGAPRRAPRLCRGFARGAVLAVALVACAGGARAQGFICSDPCPIEIGELVELQYEVPTTRYPHGVLGDAIEWEMLSALTAVQATLVRRLRVWLDAEHVFEDIAPREADLDFDGQSEIITVRSNLTLGAQLAIYRPDFENLTFELVATTPYIGRRNRWLAPVGVADFNGDGQMDIAYVDRPHLARTLRIWSFVPGGLAGTGELREIANAGGFSNHRIGEDFITGGVRDCGAGPEMVLADAGWTSVMIARMVDGAIEAEPVAVFSPEAVAAALDCR